MTRDEAIAIIKATEKPGMTVAEMHVDAWVALGMLKLNEPDSPWEMFRDKMALDYGYMADDANAYTIIFDIKKALDEAGLMIVEK